MNKKTSTLKKPNGTKPIVVLRFLCFLGLHKWKVEGGGSPQWWINERVCIYCRKIHNDD